MGNKQRKVLGGRSYQRYNPIFLKRACAAVARGESIRSAAERFAVPRSTIQDHLKKIPEKKDSKPGRRTVLTENEEKILVNAILKCCDWGISLSVRIIKQVVQEFLNRVGKRDPRWKDNRPGKDWIKSFLIRHPILSERFAENIKRARASVTKEIVEEYFNELEKSLEGVKAECIINYDETNFVDDPGLEKVVVRRGCKHPEVVKDTSKSAVSVMFAGTASGTLLPPYIVYKSKNIYQTWEEGGIEGSKYNCSLSGWFNMPIFEDWFFKIVVPYFRALEGLKILIGDNLCSHVSHAVISKCEELNIRFVLLPPNTTHLTQPLDVAVFRGLKIKWRKVLNDWKMKHYGPLQKSEFPKLLKRTVEEISSIEDNLESGFSATGIYPFNPSKVLNKIPGEPDKSEKAYTVEDQVTHFSDAFTSVLRERRFNTATARKPRGRKVNVPAGRSYSTSDLPPSMVEDECDDPETPSENEVSSENETEEEEVQEKEDNEHLREGTSISTEYQPAPPAVNDFYVTEFKTDRNCTRKFAAIILKIENHGKNLKVKCLRRKKGLKNDYFVYPNIEDISVVDSGQLLRKLTVSSIKRGKHIFIQDTTDLQ